MEKKQNPFQSYAFAITKGNKIAGIIVSILLILMGAWLLVKPLRSLIAFEYAAAVALIVFGVFRFFAYFGQPKEGRSSWMIVNAILLAVTGVLIALQGPLAAAGTFAYLFSFLSISSGISKFGAVGALKAAGARTGGVILSAILDILMAVFFLVAPFITQWLFAILAGIYLIVGGFSLLVEFGSMETK